MTEAEWIAVIVAIPPTLAILVSIIINWMNHVFSRRQVDTINRKTDMMGRKADIADGKLNHITDLTNSNLAAANQRIDKLETIIEKLIEEREERARRNEKNIDKERKEQG